MSDLAAEVSFTSGGFTRLADRIEGRADRAPAVLDHLTPAEVTTWAQAARAVRDANTTPTQRSLVDQKRGEKRAHLAR
jgi:hypothetical protein